MMQLWSIQDVWVERISTSLARLLCLFCFAAQSALSFSFPFATSAEAEPITQIEWFDDIRVSKSGSIFTFDENGRLIDGHRAGEGEPIDFSMLLKLELLALDLVKATNGCFPCGREGNYWPPKVIPLKVVARRRKDALPYIPSMAASIVDTLSEAGIETRPAKGEETAKLTILFGNARFLLRHAEQLGDAQGVSLYQQLVANEHRDRTAPATERGELGLSYCRVSLDQNGTDTSAIIWSMPQDFENCFVKQLLLSVGLNSFSGFTPSILNEDFSYTVPTDADEFFLKLMADHQVP